MLAAIIGTLVTGAGCNQLLDVEIPGRVSEQDLDDPALAATLVAGALGEFECAFNQLVPTNAFLTGEFISSNFFLDSNAWGRREEPFMLDSPGACPAGRGVAVYGYYTPMQRARWMAEDAARRIEAFPDAEVPDKPGKLAALYAYAGYAYIHLGQNYCEIAVDNGPLMTTDEVLDAAVERFTDAIQLAQSAGNSDILNMARVGRARAYLNLNRLDEAAQDAEQVPEGFVRYAAYSTASVRRENSTYNRTETLYLSVGEDWRNLEVDGAPDPRVPVEDTGIVGQDGTTSQWNQMKYTLRSDPIPIASWREAQFIIAEARGGQEAIDAMNRVRALHNLSPLSLSDVDDMLATILEERRREFFLEGQRHSDMIRHNIPFPSGLNHKGQIFQDYECMPLPNVERFNNPNISG
jgi:tetratricopeptide (TPR) repeat protein